MGGNYVTPEQIEKARAMGLLDYLHQAEPHNLIRSAPDEYRLKDHDSLKISNGKFHWFSRGIGGTNAVDYLVKVRGLSFVNAVQELSGEIFTAHTTINNRAPPLQEHTKHFILPEKNIQNDDVIAYLKRRSIDESIVQYCIETELLYQSKSNTCIFVGYDNNVPKYACERSIQSDSKKDVTGSTKAHGFCMPPMAESFHKLYVFESPIDTISHATITKLYGTDWDGYRLSLGGVSSNALNKFIESNTQITNIYLCLDNDKTGQDATERIVQELLVRKKYNIYIAMPTIGKDYNDIAMQLNEKIAERTLQANVDRKVNVRTTNKRSNSIAL